MADDRTRKAKIKLVTACFIALVFIIGEVIGKINWQVVIKKLCISSWPQTPCKHSNDSVVSPLIRYVVWIAHCWIPA